ncbi:MAG: flagellar filament outer layer protein FlaA [Treponema sp.]|jgi:hypothetical protein|nr:flagellar filament outer layer protein FlaA [Treponema sp.]
MKKTFVLLAMVLLFAVTFAFGDQSTLIDFTLLTEDSDDQNSRTTMDYSVAAPTSYTDENKAAMLTSLALGNWAVELNSSAKSIDGAVKNTVRSVVVRDNSKYFPGTSVMGVRIIFQNNSANASARIVPPFEIPAFEPLAEQADAQGEELAKTKFEDGYGVVKNVGVIKEIAVRVMGNLFPYSLFVILKDDKGVERRYPMGSLQFDGWKTISWKNPAYISDVRARNNGTPSPLYPNTELPFVKFVGFQVVKDGSKPGGDFISYFGDVRLIYDRAVLNPVRDIAEEDAWHIITDEEQKKQTAEMSNFGTKQILLNAEKEKIAAETNFIDLDNQQQGQPAAQ